jgi:hypothetical protein
MNRRSIACLALSVLVLSVVALQVSVQAEAAQSPSVPFKGVIEGTYTVTPIPPFPPQFVEVLVTATGRATQLGNMTAVFPHLVEVSTMTGVGTWTFTAANGDTLLADSTGAATVVAPGFLLVVENCTITGGTGRFAGASGEFIMERLVDQDNLTTTGHFEGTISRP